MTAATEPANPDWTEGGAVIVYQRCNACEAKQYFRRAFCHACGSTELSVLSAEGTGTVYAVSHVTRAPTPEARAHGPYTIVLVDADEGFRLMAHGAHDLAIGDRVSATFNRFIDGLVPYFERTTS
jgi:uncharacterized OB-fold protein